MTTHEQAVYIGAGCNINPILIMKDIKKFIYIDSSPFSMHGTNVYTHNNNESFNATLETRELYENNNMLGYSNFKDEFDIRMKQNNFVLVSETKYCWIYTNNDQLVKYHVSCAFPEFAVSNPEIIRDISESNILIVCGHNPNKLILKMMKEIKYVICDCKTGYFLSDDEDEKDSVITYLLENPDIVTHYKLIKDNQVMECNKLDHVEKMRKWVSLFARY
jgi:hypothetical protein